MEKINKIRHLVVIAFTFFYLMSIANAQPIPTGNGGGIGNHVGGAGGGAPLDGGLSILLILGSAFAIKKHIRYLNCKKIK
jgi:hypothetical protein